MHNAIAPVRLLATCLLFVAPVAVTHQAFAAADVEHAVCRSYDMPSKTTVYSEPMGYIVVNDQAAEMRQMVNGFHADARSRFGLGASAKTFCDLFPGEPEAQAFIDKDKRQAASSNMTVRGSDWVGDSEGFENAWEVMRFQAVQAAGLEREEAARKPVPGSRVLPAHAGFATGSSHDARREREEAKAEELARREGNLVPQTSLAAATASPHWHAALGGGLLAVVDVHGVVDGSAPGRRRMSNATFLPWMQDVSRVFDLSPETGILDFIVQDLEFDCATPRRIRRLGYATYGLVDGEVMVGVSAKTPEEWKQVSERMPDAKAWVWACKGDQKTDPLPSGISFQTMLETYRAQWNAARGRAG